MGQDAWRERADLVLLGMVGTTRGLVLFGKMVCFDMRSYKTNMLMGIFICKTAMTDLADVVMLYSRREAIGFDIHAEDVEH